MLLLTCALVAVAATALAVPVYSLVAVILLAAGCGAAAAQFGRGLADWPSWSRQTAERDQLTGLLNRQAFRSKLASRCRAEPGAGFALLLISLDGFKAVNETIGDEAGDAVLARVGSRLRAALGPSALVARLGSDEFGAAVDRVVTPADAEALAHRVIDSLRLPYTSTDGVGLHTRGSAGFVLSPSDGDTPDALLWHAGLALRRAKEDGGGTSRRFRRCMATQTRARRETEAALRRAAADGRFELHFQPQVDLRTGCYDGAEALVRWRDGTGGLVPPDTFIPIAEQAGLIAAIGEWVLRAACEAATAWPAHLNVAVNLSPLQFRDARLAQTIGRLLDQSGLAPSRLELEVTESVLIEDEERTFETLGRLRALGVRISLDDFGTGYSSLSYLRRFPFDKIKIDKSFFRKTPEDRENAAIVRAVVALGASLGITTTAEGIETEAQQRFATREGCTQMQGFLVSRPVPHRDLPPEFAAARAA